MKLKDGSDESHSSVYIRVVQHLSAACRCARMKEVSDLPVAKLLMHLDDYDLEMCREMRNASLGFVAFVIAAIPASLAFTYDPIRNATIEIILPSMWNAFLAINSILLSVSPVVLAIPYIIIFASFVYIKFIRKPARRRHIKKAWVTGLESSTLAGWMQVRVTGKNKKFTKKGLRKLWHEWLERLALLHLSDAIERNRAVKRIDSVTLWRNMNIPHSLQAQSNTNAKSPLFDSCQQPSIIDSSEVNTVLNNVEVEFESRIAKWTKPNELKQITSNVSSLSNLEKLLIKLDVKSIFGSKMSDYYEYDITNRTMKYDEKRKLQIASTISNNWKTERMMNINDPAFATAMTIYLVLDTDCDGRLLFGPDMFLFATWFLSYQRPTEKIIENEIVEMADHLAGQFNEDDIELGLEFKHFFHWFKERRFPIEDFKNLIALVNIAYSFLNQQGNLEMFTGPNLEWQPMLQLYYSNEIDNIELQVLENDIFDNTNVVDNKKTLESKNRDSTHSESSDERKEVVNFPSDELLDEPYLDIELEYESMYLSTVT
jgi:hypothetical protein